MDDPSGGGHDFSQNISGAQGIVCARCGVFYGSGAIGHGWPGVMVYRWVNPNMSGSFEPALPCNLEIVRQIMES